MMSSAVDMGNRKNLMDDFLNGFNHGSISDEGGAFVFYLTPDGAAI